MTREDAIELHKRDMQIAVRNAKDLLPHYGYNDSILRLAYRAGHHGRKCLELMKDDIHDTSERREKQREALAELVKYARALFSGEKNPIA